MDNNDTQNQNNNPVLSPDVIELNSRRNLIKSLYLEVLGREADMNGLSYYTVNKNIPESEIRKQMTQSTEHKDIVVKAQKYNDLEKKCISIEDQLIKSQNANVEKDFLINNLRNVTSDQSYHAPLPSNSSNQSQFFTSPVYTNSYEYVNDLIPQNAPYNKPIPTQYPPMYNASRNTQSPASNTLNIKPKGLIGWIKGFFGRSMI